MRCPFESPEAQRLNQQIFETIYYGALEASCELAKEQGPYETYEGSPVSKGVSTRTCAVSGPKLWKGGNVAVPAPQYRRRCGTGTPSADNIAAVQVVLQFSSIIWLLKCRGNAEVKLRCGEQEEKSSTQPVWPSPLVQLKVECKVMVQELH